MTVVADTVQLVGPDCLQFGAATIHRLADIERIVALWTQCRTRFGADGAFLFGHASIADAFFAPVAARLRSYRVELPPLAADYVATIYQWPAFQRWLQAALEEPSW